MRQRRVSRNDGFTSMMKMIQACESNPETRHVWEPALRAMHSEIERVLRLGSRSTPLSLDELAAKKANAIRILEERKFRNSK